MISRRVCKGADTRVRSAYWVVLLALSTSGPHQSIGEQTNRAAQAGALLAAGRADEAASLAASCGEPRCRLVEGRALFGLGQLPAAAEALQKAASAPGELQPHALALLGEALLHSNRAAEALVPLRAAAAMAGPAGLRASALLADALLATHAFAQAQRQAEHAASLAGQPAEVRAGLSWTAAQALASEGAENPQLARPAAEALRTFWLLHPEHPAAESARALERSLSISLPEDSGRALLLRASRLLSSGLPAAAAAQAESAARQLSGVEAAEAALLRARALSADGKRSETPPILQEAWAHGAAHVAAAAGMLLARDRARRGKDDEALQLADAVAHRFVDAPEAGESVLFTARLLADAGQRTKARARLAKLARKRNGSNASAARWTLAWMSFQDHLGDAHERFAEFAGSAASDEERAQGLYWVARSKTPRPDPSPAQAAADAKAFAAQMTRVTELDPLGWYGLLARQILGQSAPAAVAFPRLRPTPPAPAALRLAVDLASLGLLAEAAGEADWFVARHPGDAGAAALPVYESAGRYDRSVALAESLLGGRGPRAPKLILDAAYPAAFPLEVARSAARTRIDPYLLLAVMRRESLFKPDTRSVAGAVGLLQLLPATARRAAMVLGRPPLRDEELTVPGTAIDLGAWYLSELLGRFGDPAPALAAYNAGPRVAGPWASRGAGRPLDAWVEDIPYRETRRYVKIVIGSWSAYRLLAGGAAPQLAATVPAPRPGANF